MKPTRVPCVHDEPPAARGHEACVRLREVGLGNHGRRIRSAGGRFLAYGLAGWAVDSVFVALHTGRRRPSSLLNVPVYGLAQPLFEPVHDRIRDRHLFARAAVYGTGTLAVEYASGRLLRRLFGDAPWDYGDAPLAFDRLVRLDYLPLWAVFGLGLECLHDRLVT